MTDLRIFGIKHGAISTDRYQEELEDFLPSTTTAIYLEPAPGSESLRSVIFSKAALLNPTIVSVQIIRTLWNRRPWRSHSATSEWQASRLVAEERDIDCVKVGGSQLEWIESVSPHWWPLSWTAFLLTLYFLLNTLTPAFFRIFRIGSEGVPQFLGAAIGWFILTILFSLFALFLLGLLFIRPFIRTTRPHRDLAMLSNAKTNWHSKGHDEVCLVVGKGHIETLQEITNLMDVNIIEIWDIDQHRQND